MLHTIWYLFKNHTLKVEQHENNSDPIFELIKLSGNNETDIVNKYVDKLSQINPGKAEEIKILFKK